ncbi:signal peptidase I [Anaerocolumna aminovalerica]|uniref:Signal peptidase I n=2 Tax=Anaerocolumna aminovalerica TaxID=1527 RepID=A0A1I5CLM0_9FIRM|nr:signal peptidase I [Anaerocolumna aminovalerica]SFN87814.1 signal peptidase I [Anaerocolumna aminovalerica]
MSIKKVVDFNAEEEPLGGTKIMKKEIFHLLFYIILVFLATFVIINYVGQRTVVQGQSMENTLFDRDNLIINKLSYHFIAPKRFDIIVFPIKTSKKYYIKRIIGLPGETLQIKNGNIYINSELLEENYGKEIMNYSGTASVPITLNEDEYFVLGDNRNHSSDSRDPDVGVINKDRIIGKAWLRIWPLNKFGFAK